MKQRKYKVLEASKIGRIERETVMIPIGYAEFFG